MAEPLVQVVGPTDNWVLERLARRLADLLPCAEFVAWKPRPGRGTRLAYYVNYALYAGPSGLIDVGFFTHEDERFGFLDRARRMDFCVCMARLYAERLRAQWVSWVEHIPMGFDAEPYQPRLVLGVVGRLDSPRKGRHLVEELRRLPFVEVLATEGKLGEGELRKFYQRLDYVLIPATVEGGPMSLLLAADLLTHTVHPLTRPTHDVGVTNAGQGPAHRLFELCLDFRRKCAIFDGSHTLIVPVRLAILSTNGLTAAEWCPAGAAAAVRTRRGESERIRAQAGRGPGDRVQPAGFFAPGGAWGRGPQGEGNHKACQGEGYRTNRGRLDQPFHGRRCGRGR